MPNRIQRQRTAGWRMPPGCVYVGRPSRWGNPFTRFQVSGVHASMYDFSAVPSPVPGRLGCETVLGVCTDYASEIAVTLFRAWVRGWSAKWPEHWEAYIAPLVGKDLACWCPLDKPCHAEVLIELASVRELPRG